jgi:hypothetical protein
MYRTLLAHKDELISLKKAQVYKSHEKGQFAYLNGEKAIKGVSAKGFDANEDCIYPIISTTKFLDSHHDVHFNGCFAKTVSEQQGKIMYALDHQVRYDSVIAWPKDVRMFIADIDWSLVGKSYMGQTQGLVFEIKKESIKRKDVLNDIENKAADFENSISMVYYKIELGINDKDPEFKDQYAYFKERSPLIANQEDLNKIGYFWGVEELGIYKEGSLVVGGGSNSATSIYSKDNEADSITSSTEPSIVDTQKQLVNILSQIKF